MFPTNPADLASRGVGPKELVESKLWWQGPEWLLQGPDAWPARTDWMCRNKDLPELRPVILTVGPPEDNVVIHFSSYQRLLRVMSWCCRFVHNLRQPAEERKLSPLLTLQEMRRVKLVFLRQSLGRFFLEEIDCLKYKRELPKKSTLLQRRPFLDAEDLLRVGGRLRRMDLVPEHKHPIILHHLLDSSAQQVCAPDQHACWSHRVDGTLQSGVSYPGSEDLGQKSCVVCQKSYAWC